MRKLGGILVIAALALTACSAPIEATPESPSTMATPTTQPIAGLMAAPAHESSGDILDDLRDRSKDAEYLEVVKRGWNGDLPSDEVLISAGLEGCRQLLSGVPWLDVVAVDGSSESEKLNNTGVLSVAMPLFCPGTMP